MTKIIGIYKITSPSGRIYIGSTKNYKRRLAEYRTLSCKSQVRLYNSLVKYGVDNHRFELIHECDVCNLLTMESYYGTLFNVLDRKAGLNSKIPKSDEKAKCVSDETIMKMRIARIGWKPTKEAIEKSRLSNIGRKQPRESVERVAKLNTGKKRSEQQVLANSIAIKKYWEQKGIFTDEERKQRARDAAKRYRLNHPERIEINKIKRKERDKRLNRYPGVPYNRKLKEESVIEIRRLYAEGKKQKDIASIFNIGLCHVSFIINRKLWKHVI